MNETINQKVTDYLYKNRFIIIYSFIIAILCYGYELFNFTLSPDEEVQSFKSASELKKIIVDGRWGSYLFQIIISPHSIMPYIPTLISIICLAVTSILFVTGEKSDTTSKIVFSSIFITYPLHSYYLAFNVLSAALTFAMALNMGSFLLVKELAEKRGSPILFLSLAVLSLMFSFSIYQGVVPLFVLVTAIYFFMRLFNNESVTLKTLFRRALLFFAVFCIALLLYKLVDWLMNLFLVPELKNVTDYIDHYRGWNKQPFSQVVITLISSTLLYLIGNQFYGAYSVLSVFLLIPFVIYLIFKNVKSNQNKISAILLLSLIFISPFLVMYVAGSPLPARSLIGLPFMLAFFWWFSYPSLNRWFKKIMLIVVFFVVMSNIYHTTRLFYAGTVSWNADRDMANQIVNRIYSLDLPVGNNELTVAFIGKYKHQENELFFNSNVFGASFFSWDNGNPGRIHHLFKTIGISNLNVLPKRATAEIGKKIKSVPCWPGKGSVFLMNDTIVVKLSETK